MKGLSVTNVVIPKPHRKTSKTTSATTSTTTEEKPEESVHPMPNKLCLDKDYILPWGRRKDLASVVVGAATADEAPALV